MLAPEERLKHLCGRAVTPRFRRSPGRVRTAGMFTTLRAQCELMVSGCNAASADRRSRQRRWAIVRRLGSGGPGLDSASVGTFPAGIGAETGVGAFGCEGEPAYGTDLRRKMAPLFSLGEGAALGIASDQLNSVVPRNHRQLFDFNVKRSSAVMAGSQRPVAGFDCLAIAFEATCLPPEEEAAIGL
jgi:hypothetical protein